MIIHGDGFHALKTLPADSAKLVFCDPVWGVQIDTAHQGAAKFGSSAQRAPAADLMWWETAALLDTIRDGLRVADHVLLKLSGRPDHVGEIYRHLYGAVKLAYMFTWDKGPCYPSACNSGISESRESLWWFTRDGTLRREAEWNKGFQGTIRDREEFEADTDGILRFRKVRDEDRLTRHVFEMSRKLCEWVIRVFTLPGDTIVDPCCGSGALLAYARCWGRQVRGWEIDPAMAAAAHAALSDPRPLVERGEAPMFQ